MNTLIELCETDPKSHNLKATQTVIEVAMYVRRHVGKLKCTAAVKAVWMTL